MSKHLLALSIGPVQGFIAAARRTRDLWSGSLILSEVSKAAARCVAENSGYLIFPSLKQDDPGLRPLSPVNVANIVLAELPEGVNPAELAEKAQHAANASWMEVATKAKIEAEPYINPERWRQQAEDIVEFYASWVPFKEAEYMTSRQRLMHLMAGRKACRDFLQERSKATVPKSSLDGARDTIWKDPKSISEMNRRLNRRLRLSQGEQLDAVGLTKRLAFGEKPYPSVSRIAADPWLRGLAATGDRHGIRWKGKGNAKELFEELKTRCAKLTHYGLGRVGPDLFPQFKHFPFEGTAVYRNRHKDLKFEIGEEHPAVDMVDDLGKTLSELLRGLGEPEPYLAVLAADGDRMGKVISSIDSPEKHRTFSKELAQFAGEAKQIVEKQYGCLVYSGGDDVLAFVPVDLCLKCANQLQTRFAELLFPFKTPQGHSTTLSVGIAIGHCMEPLENLLEYGRAAEKAAKMPDRDGLAVHVHTRGGAPVRIRGQWRSGIIDRLDQWQKFHREGRVSHKTAYDVKQLALAYAGWQRGDETSRAIHDDLLRLLNRKRPQENKKLAEHDIDRLMEGRFHRRPEEDPAVYHPDVLDLANELIVAWRVFRAERQAQGITQEANRGRS